MDEKLLSVSHGFEGLDTSSFVSPEHSQTIEPIVLPDLGSASKLVAGLSVPELNNLGITYPLKKQIGSGYFLRSCTKLHGFNPLLSDNGLGHGVLGGSD